MRATLWETGVWFNHSLLIQACENEQLSATRSHPGTTTRTDVGHKNEATIPIKVLQDGSGAVNR